MAKEANKRDVESICARVTKHASKKMAKAEVNPFDANVLTGFTMFLFVAAPVPRVRRG